MAESSTDTMGSSTDAILAELTTRMTQVLNQHPTQNHSYGYDQNTQLGIKLNGTNYALWSQIVEMFIAGRDKLGYLNGDFPQPPENDPGFRKWRTENAAVKGWILNSLDTKLIGNFIRFPTAKAVWESIATTFYDGTDASQLYDLKRKVSKLKQDGGSIQTYYTNLQGLWREIDFRRLNPMICDTDISKYNSIVQQDRVYTFLDGLDDRLDQIRGDVLQVKPLPTVEEAYAQVRREDLRQSVMMVSEDAGLQAGAMLSRGTQKPYLSLNMTSKGKLKSQKGVGCTHCGNENIQKKHVFRFMDIQIGGTK